MVIDFILFRKLKPFNVSVLSLLLMLPMILSNKFVSWLSPPHFSLFLSVLRSRPVLRTLNFASTPSPTLVYVLSPAVLGRLLGFRTFHRFIQLSQCRHGREWLDSTWQRHSLHRQMMRAPRMICWLVASLSELVKQGL